MREMLVSKVRASGLYDPPHCGQAHVTICHVSAAAPPHTMLEEAAIKPSQRGPELGRSATKSRRTN